MAQQAGSGGARADIGPRILAFIIDIVILGVINGILGAVLKVPGYALGTIISLGYLIYFEGGETGQTLGKKAMNIRVVDAETGGALGYGKAALRNTIGRIVSGFICYLGYFWALWDPEKQAWHDKIAKTYVVPA
jgi:uncharacterized RDD family membrane protein YckC